MIDAARKAARQLKRDFGEVENLQVSRKGAADFVTAADLKAEQTLVDELNKSRPGYGFLAEERGLVEGTDKTHTWIIDPLDGTTNFMHGVPHWAINIALEREGSIVAALTYNPIVEELFWAERGKGAFLEGSRRLRVTARRTLDEALLATGIPFAGRLGHAQFLKELHQVSGRVAGVRRFGSAALDMAWVAAGRYDGYWERNLSPWDIAAGLLLITEAGGKVTSAEPDGEGDPRQLGSVVAGNLDIHPLILERLRAAG
jgi:myo-inositol-1(or 4)-monophosphatase